MEQNNIVVIDGQADRSAFLSARKTLIGSSDIAAIAGLDPYRTPIGVWMDKKGYNDALEENDAMWFGTVMEPLVALRYSDLNHVTVERCQTTYALATHPWAAATPDYWLPETGQILEIKTTEMNWDDGIPERVSVQVTWQMGVMGAKTAIVAALGRGRKLISTEVQFDQALFDGLLALGQDFVDKYLSTETPPPPLKSLDRDLLAEYYKANEGQTIDLNQTPGILLLIEEWGIAKAIHDNENIKVKECKEHMKLVEAKLRAEMKEATLGIYGDRAIVIKNIQRKAYEVKASTYQTFTIK